MILGPISLFDCVVFVLFLIPQLLIQVPIYRLASCLIRAIPFLVLTLPFTLIRERYVWPRERRSPFTRGASLFQDIVLRCVRYAFANIPASIGRVFFSKWVAYPFIRSRMLRHGIFRSPIYHREIRQDKFAALWITPDRTAGNDIAILYCHGGGFSMGSSYFYLEYLMVWISCLQARGYKNPLVLAVEYTLVPDKVYPVQFDETRAAYRFLVEQMGDSSNICVSGDSAGGTLVLSNLLAPFDPLENSALQESLKPGLAVLISPWTHLISDLNRNTPSDYLDYESLRLYGHQYAGSTDVNDPIMSPGLRVGSWRDVSPKHGFHFIFGEEEVFAKAIAHLIFDIEKDDVEVTQDAKKGGIHAWPVVNLFLGSSRDERLEGLDKISDIIAMRMGNTIPVKSIKTQ